MLAKLNSRDFTPLLQKHGTLHSATGQVMPILIEEVTEKPNARPPRHAPDRRTPFSILFSVLLSSPSLFEGICTLDIQGIGIIEGLFVVRIIPLDEENQKAWYQIVIN